MHLDKKRCLPFFLILALSAVAMLYFVLSSQREAGGVLPGSERTLRYTFTVENESSEEMNGHLVKMFVPFDSLGYQRLISISSTKEYLLEEYSAGRDLVFHFSSLLPGESRRVVITAKVNRINAPLPEGVSDFLRRKFRSFFQINREPDFSRYLASQRYVETDSLQLINAAMQFDGINKFLVPRAVYDWVRDRITYAGYVSKMNGALYAYEQRSGDCSEYSALMVAMLRLNGIPARIVAGYQSDASVMLLDKMRYHNWVEYYLDGRWHVTDPQGGIFSPSIESYVSFREIDGVRRSEVRFSASHDKLAVAAL